MQENMMGMTFPEILAKVQNMSLLEILGKLHGGACEGSGNEANINIGLYILV